MEETSVPDRHPEGNPSVISNRLLREGYLFDFFQAARLLEELFTERKTTAEGSVDHSEQIRFRPHTGLAFPATDVRSIEITDGSPRQAVVTVTFMGLYGVDSPLPVYFYDSIATEAERTRPLRDFLDVFNHRLYTLFYRSWKKYRPSLHFGKTGEDEYTQRALCLAGLGTGQVLAQPPVSRLRLAALAGHLMSRVRNAEGVQSLLSDFFEEIGVGLQENVPRWVPIPVRAHLGKGGRPSMTLGFTSTIGQRVFDISGKFRIVLGPLTMAQYLSFLPEGSGARILHYLVRLRAPDHLDYDVRLVLKTAEIQPLRLGDAITKLGLTTWVGRPAHDVTSRIVAYA